MTVDARWPRSDTDRPVLDRSRRAHRPVVIRAPEPDNVTALNGLTQLGALLAGPVLAMTGVLHLVERRPAATAAPACWPATDRPVPPGRQE
jgi:hypothetical protein